jgi:hypothetical protein
VVLPLQQAGIKSKLALIAAYSMAAYTDEIAGFEVLGGSV